MGRRKEQRIVIAFPVVVRGSDARGSPFSVKTETCDISCTGACLKSLQGVVEPGKKIEIECQNQRAWYRVQWAGFSGRTREWRIGVRCLEPGKYIWGVPPKEWEPDSFDPEAANSPGFGSSAAPPPKSATPPRERRRFARRSCCLEAQVSTDGPYGRVVVKGKVTDISLGGCYVEMLSPFPDGTSVELDFSTGQAPLHLSAKVCSAQGGFGMGVVFTGMNPEDFEMLRQFAPPAKDAREDPRNLAPPANTSGSDRIVPYAPESPRGNVPPSRAPEHPRMPRHREPESDADAQFCAEFATELPGFSGAVEALVRLLLRKGVLTHAEILEEIERLKAAQT